MSERLAIGDIVTINIGKESREWGYNPAPNGTEVEIVGFSEIHCGRINWYDRKPGVYENDSWPIVKYPDGKVSAISVCHIKYKKKIGFPKPIFIRDLPETEYWEFDQVKSSRAPEWETSFIYNINWNSIGIFCSDGVTPMPIYDISPDRTGGCTTSARPYELELVKRGNVWNYYHNLPLEFADVKEEVHFFYKIGKYKEIRNPRNELYSWNDEDINNGIKLGIIDVRNRGSAIKFDDPVLSQKIRDNDLYAIM